MDVRSWLRSAEFHLPAGVSALLLRLGPAHLFPYGPHHDRLAAILVHIPKTAGTSMTHALFGAPARHIPLVRFLAADRVRYEKYFKFAFVRNPWDRLYSAFVYLKPALKGSDAVWVDRHLRGLDTFEAFVSALDNPIKRRTVMAWTHFRPQCDWIRPGPAGRHGLDFVGRYESLHEDFAVVCRRLGVECSLPHVRRRAHAPYREVYTPAMVDRVGRWYSEDVQAFGYSF